MVHKKNYDLKMWRWRWQKCSLHCEHGQLLHTVADIKIVKHLIKERMYLGKEDNISTSEITIRNFELCSGSSV